MTRMLLTALMIGSLVSIRPAITYAGNADRLLTLNELRAQGASPAAQARKNLEDPRAQALLADLGISKAEASARIANLSDREVESVLKGETQLRAGGDILYVVLMVLLIIFVAQRI
ncbi:MAG: PA2779 family protein [Bdellovibrionaceae bacterium]|nr:PA2779 family protein [Pseudobdellovibrionaceae bacterium]